jgi:hypothetical protein
MWIDQIGPSMYVATYIHSYCCGLLAVVTVQPNRESEKDTCATKLVDRLQMFDIFSAGIAKKNFNFVSESCCRRGSVRGGGEEALQNVLIFRG